MRVQCHKVLNDLGATSSSIRRLWANSEGAGPHPRVDEWLWCPYSQLGGHGVRLCLHSVETAPSNFSRRQWCFGVLRKCRTPGRGKAGCPYSGTLVIRALATFVTVTSVASLRGYSEPKPTLLGIAILVAAASVMPWLAKEKRCLSAATGSAVLRSGRRTVGAVCLPLAHRLGD